MMINKRLIGTVSESKRCIACNVLAQWVALIHNILLMAVLTRFLSALFLGQTTARLWAFTFGVALWCALARFVCARLSARMSFLSGKTVKITLRQKIYRKLLRLGSSYSQKVKTAEVVQVAVEGCDQLETYFGAYLPQFFYAMLAPLTLFVVLSFVNFPSALVLLLCVPVIPVSIALVQTFAKKLLSKYWDRYTGLGDTFLENLQGLTTLKIYRADEARHRRMNEEAETFRRITMRVLTMQLNSITLMDLVAYGGAALGVIMAVTQMNKGAVDLQGCLLIILLAADYFIPMRMLGSFFHIAMNGMAASDKIFALLDLPEEPEKKARLRGDCTVEARNLSFAYEKNRPVLRDVTLTCPMGSFTAIVGESGCGKSTLASLIMGRSRGYTGSLTIGGVPLRELNEQSLMENFTYVSHKSYLFKGSVRDNLLLGRPGASDAELEEALRQVRLLDFLNSEQGLDTQLLEQGANLSGGQCQRLALARALLHDSPAYIFDEATSNIDVESENDIMAQIHELAKTRTVLLISHRLANVAEADRIYVLDGGRVAESGTHQELLAAGGLYRRLWDTQQELEQYVQEVQA